MNARSVKRAFGLAATAPRNAGWRAARPAPWVVFLDDDVRVGPRWREELAADLAGLAPGLIGAAAAALGVDPARCVVIGDIGADAQAAHAAGARAILVPTLSLSVPGKALECGASW
jgi:phosphoglycolate phosphatase-like HAD superfamily hydrolase